VIYRIRTYTAVPENIERFHAFFRDFLLPIQLRHGARLIGRWASDDRIVAVWEYDDIDAYHRIDAAVRADPDSAVARAHADTLGPIYLSRDDQFMHSTLDDEAPGTASMPHTA
jgi:NIPSNAP